jgi:hypothetical protein
MERCRGNLKLIVDQDFGGELCDDVGNLTCVATLGYIHTTAINTAAANTVLIMQINGAYGWICVYVCVCLFVCMYLFVRVYSFCYLTVVLASAFALEVSIFPLAVLIHFILLYYFPLYITV